MMFQCDSKKNIAANAVLQLNIFLFFYTHTDFKIQEIPLLVDEKANTMIASASAKAKT